MTFRVRVQFSVTMEISFAMALTNTEKTSTCMNCGKKSYSLLSVNSFMYYLYLKDMITMKDFHSEPEVHYKGSILKIRCFKPFIIIVMLYIIFNIWLIKTSEFQSKFTMLTKQQKETSISNSGDPVIQQNQDQSVAVVDPYHDLEFDCETKAREINKTVIIFPFRHRIDQLKLVMSSLHRLLMEQKLKYDIYVIEQDDKLKFNRGKLLNVGVKEAVFKIGESQRIKCHQNVSNYCLVLHDIDLIPESLSIPYNCESGIPTLLSTANSKFNYSIPYNDYFGGVTSFPLKDYLKINGMANK